MLANPAIRQAVGKIDVSAVLLLAERGMRNEETPMYATDTVSGLRTRRGALDSIRLPGTNHYTVMFSASGSRAVAYQLRRLTTAMAASRSA
jgi:hypothetical protein